MRSTVFWAIFLVLCTPGILHAVPIFESGVHYVDPSGGRLGEYWEDGWGIDFRFPVRYSDREYLSLDLGWQYFGAVETLGSKTVHGLRALLTEHIVFSASNPARLFLGVGIQSFNSEEEKEYLVYAKAVGIPPNGGRIQGYGVAGTVGVSLSLFSNSVGQFEFQGSWNYGAVEGKGQTYYLIGLALATGKASK